MTSSLNRDENDFFRLFRVGCSFACLEVGIIVACLHHTLSAEYALAIFYADLC